MIPTKHPQTAIIRNVAPSHRLSLSLSYIYTYIYIYTHTHTFLLRGLGGFSIKGDVITQATGKVRDPFSGLLERGSGLKYEVGVELIPIKNKLGVLFVDVTIVLRALLFGDLYRVP